MTDKQTETDRQKSIWLVRQIFNRKTDNQVQPEDKRGNKIQRERVRKRERNGESNSQTTDR